MTSRKKITLSPTLVVRDGVRALEFYKDAIGAQVVASYVDKKIGKMVHADLAVGDTTFSVADENRESHNDAPHSLGGTSVILTLEVDDARAFGAQMERAGAKVVFPMADHFYGYRQGRYLDPYGHMWIVSQKLVDMTPEEVQRGVDAFSSE